MMISPETYINTQKRKTYKELLKERNKLINDIKNFESGNIENSNLIIEPAPEVIYQCNLMYLGELCKLILEKYNKKNLINEKNNKIGK